MPEITLENDPTLMTVTIPKHNKKAHVDALELVAAFSANDHDEKSDETYRMAMVESVRQVAYPTDLIGKMTDHECFAFGEKVLREFKRLGNE